MRELMIVYLLRHVDIAGYTAEELLALPDNELLDVYNETRDEVGLMDYNA